MSPFESAPLRGRVAIVSGANTGIGRVTALELARMGMRVFVATRSRERTQGVLADIQALPDATPAEWLPLELGDLDSVRACASAFLARDLPLHLLVNNAGLAGAKGRTASGFEMAFGVNHVGTFAFTQSLLPRLQASAPARIVTVASRAHFRAGPWRWEPLQAATASRTGVPEYSTSKLANVLFSAELARRLAGTGVTTYAVHPGVVASDVWRAVPPFLRGLIKLTMISNEEGARTSLHCATAPERAAETGLYYDKCQPKTPSAQARDAKLAAELWTRSLDWTRTPALADDVRSFA